MIWGLVPKACTIPFVLNEEFVANTNFAHFFIETLFFDLDVFTTNFKIEFGFIYDASSTSETDKLIRENDKR